jgi:hypothetical protein
MLLELNRDPSMRGREKLDTRYVVCAVYLRAPLGTQEFT